jgi:putative salt-induced outer membrane protein YdiY
MRHVFAILLLTALARAETLEQAVKSYLAAAEPAVTKPWEVTGALGLSYSEGNSEAISLNAGIEAVREWTQWKLQIVERSLFTETSGVTEDNEHILITRLDYKLSKKASIFASLWFEWDTVEEVEPRIQLTVAYDRLLVEKERFELKGNLGGGVLYENFPVGDKTEGIAQAGLDWNWKITDQLTYTQVFRWYPSLSEGGEFRFVSESVFSTPIAKRFDLRLTIRDDYNSNPEPGIKKNDIKIILSIAIRFTKPKEESKGE